VPGLDGKEKVEEAEPPADDLHWQKAQLLGNGGLVDFAVRELQAAAGAAHSSWAPAETAKLYAENGQYDRAIELMKHTAPSYFAVDLPTLPHSYWEALFPKPYWTDLKRDAAGNGLDPYLVASLIRQESEFNPEALSPAQAYGLTQILPSTGRMLLKVSPRRFRASILLRPEVNLRLGTEYLRDMYDNYSGRWEKTLASYNAGGSRVQNWSTWAQYREPAEFVETIPFSETRNYVLAVLRNASMYRKLYSPEASGMLAADHLAPPLRKPAASSTLMKGGFKRSPVVTTRKHRTVQHTARHTARHTVQHTARRTVQHTARPQAKTKAARKAAR
jgi:soluble lytic murein transglycosylase